MNTAKIKTSLLLIGLLFAPILLVRADQKAASSVTNLLTPAKIETKVKEEVADLHVTTGATLFDVDLAGAVGFSTKYKYEVEPSHKAGFYTRVDEWKLKVNLRPGDIIKGLAAPIFFNIEKGENILFIRQFKKQKKALIAKPYTILRLPLNAQLAKEKLRPGDLVQIPTTMSLAFGAGTGKALNIVDAGVSVVKALSGEFFFNIFRMKNNHVRVRIISKKMNNRNLGVGAELEFDIFGIRILDNVVEKLIETDLAKLDFGKNKGEQFILDYIFDLNDKAAIAAYNEILSATYKLKELEIMREFIRKKGLGNTLFHIFEKSERLALQDQNETSKRAERLFKGFNQFKGNNRELKFGAIITSFMKETVYRKNILAEENLDGSLNKFIYHTITANKGRKFGLGPLSLKERANKTIFAILPEKIASSKTDFADLGFSFNISDSILRVREQKYLKRDLKMNLPKYVEDQLNWHPFARRIKNAKVNIEVYINGAAFINVQQKSRKELKRIITKFLKMHEREGKTFGEVATNTTLETIFLRNLNEYYEKRKLAKVLHKALYGKISAEKRVDLIMSLKKNSVFRKIGFAVILSLLDERDLTELTYTKLKISGKKIAIIYFEDGVRNIPSVYKQLRSLQNVFDGNNYSMFL